jgi:CRISPR-associated protein Cas2
MDIVVTYDVNTETPEGRKRLRKVADICLGFGQRVQKSVFECSLTEMQLTTLQHALMHCIDDQQDSLRIYRLPQPRARYLWTHGVQHDVDYHGTLII